MAIDDRQGFHRALIECYSESTQEKSHRGEWGLWCHPTRPKTARDMWRPKAFVLFATLLICGCSENATRVDGPDMMPMQNATDSSVPDAQADPTQWTTERVFNAMAPLCAQCHAEGPIVTVLHGSRAFQEPTRGR